MRRWMTAPDELRRQMKHNRWILITLASTSTLYAQATTQESTSRPVPRLEVKPLLFEMKGHASVPSGCAFSPDSRFLAVARGYDGHDVSIFSTDAWVLCFQDRAPSDRKAETDGPWPCRPPVFGSKSDRLAYTTANGLAVVRCVSGKWDKWCMVQLPTSLDVGLPSARKLGTGPRRLRNNRREWRARVRRISARWSRKGTRHQGGSCCPGHSRKSRAVDLLPGPAIR